MPAPLATAAPDQREPDWLDSVLGYLAAPKVATKTGISVAPSPEPAAPMAEPAPLMSEAEPLMSEPEPLTSTTPAPPAAPASTPTGGAEPSPPTTMRATAAALARRQRGAPGGGLPTGAPGAAPAPAGAPRPFAGVSNAELERQRIMGEAEPERERRANAVIEQRLEAQRLNDKLRAAELRRDRARGRATAIASEPLRPERYVDDMSFGDTVMAVMAAVLTGLAGRPERFHQLLEARIERDLGVQKENRSMRYQQAVAALGDESAAVEALRARQLQAAADIAKSQAELGSLNAAVDGQLATVAIRLEQSARESLAKAQQMAIEQQAKTQAALDEYAGKKALDRAYATPTPVPEGDAGQLAALRKKYGVSDDEWKGYQTKAGPVRVADAELDDVERYIDSIAPQGATGTAPGYLRGGHEVWSLFASNEGNALQQKIGSVVSSVLKSQPGPASDTDIALATRGIIADGTLPAIRRGLAALRTRNRRSLDAYAQQFPGAADAARELSALRTRRSATADPHRAEWQGGR